MKEELEILASELKIIIEKNPNDFNSRRKYAEILLELNKLNEALEEFKFLLKIFTNDPTLYSCIGSLFEKLKDFDLAQKAYEKAIELDPDNYLFHYNLAFMFDENGKIYDAIKEYQITISLNDGDQNSYFNLGCLYSKQKKIDKAINCFQRALELDPMDPIAHYNLAYEYRQCGKTKEAMSEYYKVLELSPDYSWAYYNIGCIFYEDNNVVEALKAFKKVVEINPKDIEALNSIVGILAKLGKYDFAINVIEDSIINNPTNGELHYKLAQLCKMKKMLDPALFHLEKALQYNESVVSVNLDYILSEISALKNFYNFK